MIKKIIIAIFILFSFLINQVFAEVTLQTSTNISPLYIGKISKDGVFSGWQREVTLSENDKKVVFHIHAYANGGDINELQSKLEDIRGKNFLKGREYFISGSVSASNAATIIDTVKIYSKSSIKLNYSNHTWAIKLKGVNPEENEHIKTLPYGQIGADVFSGEGVSLGDLEQDYRSNLLLYFNIDFQNKPSVVNGLCSSKLNKCLKGTFVDYKDSLSSYIWNCRGLNGGSTDICSIKKEIINGICGKEKDSCLKGKFLSKQDTSKEFLWTCSGLNNGKDKNCSLKKIIYSGECGEKLNTCKKGEFLKHDDDKYYQKWICKGKNNGEDKICMIEKMCPCSQIKEAEDNCNSFGDENYKKNKSTDKFYEEEEKLGNSQGPQQKQENSGGWVHWINYFILIFIIIILSIRLATRKRS